MPRFVFLIMLFTLVGNTAQAANTDIPARMKNDLLHITTWNAYADSLFRLHTHQIRTNPIEIITSRGGYANYPAFYHETRYHNKQTGRLLSRIQRESNNLEYIHLIEVFIYDDQGKLKRDYMAAYLPEFHNAPVQTLINFHYQDDELKAFRQFDASGNRIYEQCEGDYFGESVMLSLDEHEIPQVGGVLPGYISSDLYLACFNHLPAMAGKYTDPKAEIATTSTSPHLSLPTYEEYEKKLAQNTNEIAVNPDNPALYIQRGKLYFEMYEFAKSVDDLSFAIQLDKRQDDAYFWRGMALARDGRIDEGIADLTVYLQRNPDSSLAYTKRGVRHIWKGNLQQAEQDLSRAIQLDPDNAEAHDDLGVIYAQKGKLGKAIKHFSTTIQIDPNYQKAYHNLATAYFLASHLDSALVNINQALKLSPNSRNSLLLKGEVLKALGHKNEAQRLIDDAEFLPEGNWSEQWSIR